MVYEINSMESINDESSKEFQLRPINCELNCLTRTDGSALLTQGETAVLASMYGPIEGKPHLIDMENAIVEVNFRSKSGFSIPKQRVQEYYIRKTCEIAILRALHPRTSVSIQIQEMEIGAGIDACAVNASCLALLIGGVAMQFAIAGVHCIINKDSQLIIDPTQSQMIDLLASFTFVFDSLDKNLVACSTNGKFSLSQFNEALALTKIASDKVFQFYKNIIGKTHFVNNEASDSPENLSMVQ